MDDYRLTLRPAGTIRPFARSPAAFPIEASRAESLVNVFVPAAGAVDRLQRSL